MKHLQKFDSHTEFESAQLDPLYIAVDNEHVHYSVNRSTDIPNIPIIKVPLGADGVENGYGYVDLGLPSGVKWAQCNVGANTPCDPGEFFVFGQTYGYRSDDPYAWFDTYNPPTTSGKEYKEGESLISEDDAVSARCGGRWRMPTKKEFDELIENTDNSWVLCDVEHEGQHTSILGRLFVSKKDESKKLFLPAGGKWDNGGANHFVYIGEKGFYWTCDYESMGLSHCLTFDDYECDVWTSDNNAFNVRGVCYTESLEDGTENGHEYIDLGLPSGTKWAKCNIGASNPYDTVLFFEWGRVDEYTYGAIATELSGIYPPPSYSGGKIYSADEVLNPEDDTASILMGGKWRMPTKEDIEELIDNTIKYNTTNNIGQGEYPPGILFVSKKDASKKLFIPANNFSSADVYVWSSTAASSKMSWCCYGKPSKSDLFAEMYTSSSKFPVRGVFSKNN